MIILGFDAFFEVGNVLVSGNFDLEKVVIIIFQDPAINGEVGVRVRHYALWLVVGRTAKWERFEPAELHAVEG